MSKRKLSGHSKRNYKISVKCIDFNVYKVYNVYIRKEIQIMDKIIRFTKKMQKAVEYYRILNANNDVFATLEDSYILRCIITEWATDHLNTEQFVDYMQK